MSSGEFLRSVSDSDDIGWAAGSHLWSTFHDLVEHPSSFAGEKFVRLNTGEPHPFANFVVMTDVDDAELTKDAVAPLVETPAPAAVIVVSKQKEGAGIDVLAECGFGLAEEMPAMAVNIDSLADTSIAEGYEFARIDQSDREEWIQCLAAGYEIPPMTAGAFTISNLSNAPDDAVQYFAAKHGGEIVAVSMVNMQNGIAGIYCVATLSEHRGKGLGAHVTAEPLRIAKGLGYGVGVLQSSEMGHGVYSKLGFSDVGKIPVYVRMP